MDVNHPHRYRVQTGSHSDILLGITFLLLSVPAYLVAQEGYERFVRITQGSVESAVRDYNDMSRTHRVLADIRAHNLVTKRSLSGRFELLGSIDDHTLVFRDQSGEIRTLGMEYQSDYAADKVIAVRGEAVRTMVSSIDLAGQRMRDLAGMVNHNPEALLFGTLAVDRDIAIPQHSDGFQTIQGRLGSLHLAFASAQEITDAGLGDVLAIRGTLTVRQIIAVSDSGHVRDVLSSFWPTRAFTLTAGKGERILRIRREGDAVSIGDTLALRTASLETHAKLDALHEDLRRLSEETNALRTSYRERLVDLLEKCRRDSQDFRLAVKLRAAGFCSNLSVESRQVALARQVDQREKLRESFRRALGRLVGRMEKIEESIMHLRTADSNAQAALRSPVCGVVRSIRFIEQGGGTEAVFTIAIGSP